MKLCVNSALLPHAFFVADSPAFSDANVRRPRRGHALQRAEIGSGKRAHVPPPRRPVCAQRHVQERGRLAARGAGAAAGRRRGVPRARRAAVPRGRARRVAGAQGGAADQAEAAPRARRRADVLAQPAGAVLPGGGVRLAARRGGGGDDRADRQGRLRHARVPQPRHDPAQPVDDGRDRGDPPAADVWDGVPDGGAEPAKGRLARRLPPRDRAAPEGAARLPVVRRGARQRALLQAGEPRVQAGRRPRPRDARGLRAPRRAPPHAQSVDRGVRDRAPRAAPRADGGGGGAERRRRR